MPEGMKCDVPSSPPIIYDNIWKKKGVMVDEIF